MVVTKYLTVLSGKYLANLYRISDSAGCLNFTGYRIPVSGSGTSLIRGLFVLFVNYSSTIRGLLVVFVDYSLHYSSFINYHDAFFTTAPG
jgi:hypothetical protein